MLTALNLELRRLEQLHTMSANHRRWNGVPDLTLLDWFLFPGEHSSAEDMAFRKALNKVTSTNTPD